MPHRLCTSALCLCLLASLGFDWPGHVDQLATRMERGDRAERIAAARELGRYPAADAGPAILRGLEDDELEVRLEAAQAASSAQVAEAATVVLDWLNDEDARLRAAAARTLGALRAQRALPALVRVLGDADTDVRRAAVQALGRLGAPEAVAPLLTHLDDPEDAVRMEVISALAQLGDTQAVTALLAHVLDPATELRVAIVRALVPLSAPGDTRAAAALTRMLSDASVDVRIEVASALGTIGDASTVPALSAALGDPEPRVARAALAALGRIDAETARAALVAALSSPGLAHAAVEAITRQSRVLAGRPEATAWVQSIAARVQSADASSPTPLAAAAALVHMADALSIDEALPALTQALRSGHAPLVRAALDALARMPGEAARAALIEQLTRGAPEHQGHALDALTRQLRTGAPDPRVADGLLAWVATAPTEHHARVIELLGEARAERALPLIVAKLAASDDALRRASVRAMAGVCDTTSSGALMPLLDHADPVTRAEAGRSLRACASLAAATALVEQLEAAPPESDREARLDALGGALARLRRADGVPDDLAQRAFALLTRLAFERDASTADRALEALSTWGPQAALKWLGKHLRSVSSRQRAQVTLAIARIPGEESRKVLRFVLERGSRRETLAALSALAETGDERDLGALLRAARRKHWPIPAAATYAIARLSMRGTIKPHLARRELCSLGASSEPYVQANVAAALAALRAAPCDADAPQAPNPIEWLAHAQAPAVRVAAAHWTRAAARARHIDSHVARRALLQCMDRDVEPQVRAACESEPPRGASDRVHVLATGADGQRLLRDELVALRTSAGTVFIGYADRGGRVQLPAAPPGDVVLEAPGTAPAEPVR